LSILLCVTFICTDGARELPLKFLPYLAKFWWFLGVRKKIEIQDHGVYGGTKKTVGKNGVLVFSVLLRNSLVLYKSKE